MTYQGRQDATPQRVRRYLKENYTEPDGTALSEARLTELLTDHDQTVQSRRQRAGDEIAQEFEKYLRRRTRACSWSGIRPIYISTGWRFSVDQSVCLALTMNLLLGSTPPEKAGSAASISETSGELGVALGVAALGSLATIVYRAHLTIPAATPTAADHAARQGITAATSTAQHLPGALGADLLDAARTAFTAGLTTVAGVGAAVFVGLAVLAAHAFRHIPPTGTAPEDRVDAGQAPHRAPAAVTAAPDHAARVRGTQPGIPREAAGVTEDQIAATVEALVDCSACSCRRTGATSEIYFRVVLRMTCRPGTEKVLAEVVSI